jgi:hypothetical protein
MITILALDLGRYNRVRFWSDPGTRAAAPRTADRHWAYARAWLRAAIGEPDE